MPDGFVGRGMSGVQQGFSDTRENFSMDWFLRKLLFEVCIIRTDDDAERVTPVIIGDGVLVTVEAECGHVKVFPFDEINSIEKIT